MISKKFYKQNFSAFLITLLFVQVTMYSQNFVHPGVMHTQKDLDFVKLKMQANQQPWKAAYDNFLVAKASGYQGISPKPYSSLTYVAHPYQSVDCGSYNKPNVGCNDIVYDGAAAYSLALRFYLTEDPQYATKAIEIIEAWASVYEQNTNSNSRLVVSWATPWYVNAAEILRYTPNSGWTTTNTANINTLLNKFKTYIFWEDRPSNNWMASAIEARLAIAVFQDDRTAFENAITKWKQRIKTYIYQTTDGASPIPPAGENASFVTRIWKDDRTKTAYIDGLCMETCRDINHTKLGVISFFNGAEIAWSQNVDLFSLEKKRISDFLELHSNWMTGGTVPSNICDGYLDLVSPEAFEIAYNHIHDRLKQDLPLTKLMVENNRPNPASPWVIKWETMLYANRQFEVLGIEDQISKDKHVVIFPNPSNDGLFNLSEEKKWKVYSVLGAEIKSGKGTIVDLRGVVKGLYFIKLDAVSYKVILN